MKALALTALLAAAWALLLLPSPAAAQSLAGQEAAVAGWVAAQQYDKPGLPSFGAIRVAGEPGYRAPDGTLYYQVVPYDANLAVLGLLRSHAPGGKEVAERWIGWYLAHIEPIGPNAGLIYDHWYLEDGAGETTAPPGIAPALRDHEDASDSAAATFLGVVWEYAQAGGGKTELSAPAARVRLETIAGVMLSLQQPDGLTWAKSSYHAAYTMDNSEVYFGFRAMAHIEAGVYDDPGAATRYETAAERVRAGLLNDLYDPATRVFDVARFETGPASQAKLTTWYPDTVAQAWPILFGVIDPHGAAARSALASVDNTWSGRSQPDWSDKMIDPSGSTWPSIGYAAWLCGDSRRARSHAQFVLDRALPPTDGKAFAPPFSVSDAGWLLSLLSCLGPGYRK